MGGNEMANNPFDDNTASILNIIANQQWNDQWSTYIRYWQADWDSNLSDDTENWTVGVRYQYTPAIQFKLEYDMIDYGRFRYSVHGDDNVIRFQHDGQLLICRTIYSNNSKQRASALCFVIALYVKQRKTWETLLCGDVSAPFITSQFQEDASLRHSALDAESGVSKLRCVSVFDAAGCRVRPGMTKTKLPPIDSV